MFTAISECELNTNKKKKELWKKSEYLNWNQDVHIVNKYLDTHVFRSALVNKANMKV